MDKKRIALVIYIFTLVVVLLIALVVFAVYKDLRQNHNKSYSSSNRVEDAVNDESELSSSGIMIAGAMVPIWIIFASTQTPQYPVRTVLSACSKSMSKEQLAGKIKSYLSQSFIDSDKYKGLLNLRPHRIKKITKTKEGDSIYVKADMLDGKKYTITLALRNKQADGKGVSRYVIADIQGCEFD